MDVFDAHLHIIQKPFKRIANAGFIPNFYTPENYLNELSSIFDSWHAKQPKNQQNSHDQHLCDAQNYNLLGGCIVAGSFQDAGADFLLQAMQAFKQHKIPMCAVINAPSNISNKDIIKLHNQGVRALRFNLFRGAKIDTKQLRNLAARIHEVANWHIELYASGPQLESISSTLLKLPRICIDHLGLTKSGLKHLKYLLDNGAYVKASGFSRCDFNPQPVLQQLLMVNPEKVIFGSDLPSTRAPAYFSATDLEILTAGLSTQERALLMSENALTLYKI